MNVNERNSAVKLNPLSPIAKLSKTEDLSSAEMPEVIIAPSDDGEILNTPAPLTIADVEGGELKPIPVKAVKPSQSIEVDPEVTQVRFKTLSGKLNLLLPSDRKIPTDAAQYSEPSGTTKLLQMFGNAEAESSAPPQTSLMSLTWPEIMSQLEQRLSASGYDWKPRTQVYLQAGDRLLDTRQLQEVFESLQNHQLLLHCVVTNRRQTAINAASMGFCVEQGNTFPELLGFNPIPNAPIDDPLYIKMTVRSGTEVRHSGSIIVFGDVNAGAELISEGDIIVFGKLKGMAHAGSKGNAQAIIMASHLEATQIRIASLIARVETPSTYFCPEIAFVSHEGMPTIQIVQAVNYSTKVKQKAQ
ncbi:MAG: septum site-determining protein MinC [Pseudanabaenaceae cyanobacterium bins.39]|nr:septum site-determining protein MinC [Pseudanabaenaceae cyanobacterium bins.39]